MLNVLIGYDKREPLAYDVLEHTIDETSQDHVIVTKLDLQRLTEMGLMWRTIETDLDGKMRDVISGAPMSTEFAISRFLVPSLVHSGWAIFMDCDMIMLRDIHEILPLLDESKAVMVVKHNQNPVESTKMDGQPQTAYQRKNWSSFIAWNCSHPANSVLTTEIVNSWRGLDLHQFAWLEDDQIGELPPDWNWLVNVEPMPESPAVAHFTLGGPWFADWKPQPHDDLWIKALERFRASS
jgi:lipopolysaccharide biosynthesis glycosyltransferase